MPSSIANARQVAGLVRMPRLLERLGFEANERTRRSACVLHGGSNRFAFSWTDAGLWHCHSCGAGGDRIALVRAVKQCGFRKAVEFLAQLAGVEFLPRHFSRQQVRHRERERDRAERAAWRIIDEVGRLRRYYTDGLHRVERLQQRTGHELLCASNWEAKESCWETLARLAPICTYFLAAWRFISDATPDLLARFALARSVERRRVVLEGGAM